MSNRLTEYFAYICTDRPQKVIHFTRHFSRFAAEKHYGNLSRHYRGNPTSDYSLAIYTREQMVSDLGPHYAIDFKAKTLTEKSSPFNK